MNLLDRCCPIFIVALLNELCNSLHVRNYSQKCAFHLHLLEFFFAELAYRCNIRFEVLEGKHVAFLDGSVAFKAYLSEGSEQFFEL